MNKIVKFKYKNEKDDWIYVTMEIPEESYLEEAGKILSFLCTKKDALVISVESKISS